MRITAEVCGHYDWTPCPPGTEITEADVRALRVKQMTDGSWHMKVECVRDTQHDTGIHEMTVCNRLAALEKLGRPSTREAVVVEELRESMRHHIHPKHVVSVSVHDDGPNEDLYRIALSGQGITGAEADKAVATYKDAADLGPYLNVVLRAKGAK